MDERIGFGLYQSCGNRGNRVRVCLCFGYSGAGGVGGEWIGVWTRVWSGGVMSL